MLLIMCVVVVIVVEDFDSMASKTESESPMDTTPST